jgi:hypothetical protein
LPSSFDVQAATTDVSRSKNEHGEEVIQIGKWKINRVTNYDISAWGPVV